MPITWCVISLLLVACGRGAAVQSARSERVEVETYAELEVGPGNITVTPGGRMFVSLHQFYAPAHPVGELVRGAVVPWPAMELDTVLGIQADARDVVWMLDNAMRGGGTRKLVGWNARTETLDKDVDLSGASPADAFLNDLAVDRTHGAIYIADPAGGKNAALIVVEPSSGTARRVLEGHASVVPSSQDLVIDGRPVQIKQQDGTLVRPHVGVNPIGLDAKDEYLYFGPMHGDTLHRVRTADLRDHALEPAQLAARVEVYAQRPITDGISIDTAGNIYLGDLANNAIGVIGADRRYRELASSPDLSWVDAFSYAPDGHYYVVANQLHRSAVLNAGVAATQPPFRILRFRPLAPGIVGR